MCESGSTGAAGWQSRTGTSYKTTVIIMKKRVTYEIHGQIERNSYFRIGKALVRIEFTGGAVNSTGVYPAQYTTDNALFQRAIENSDAFRRGEIRVGHSEVICDGHGDVPADEGATAATVAVTGVTNLQQARAYLMAEPYGCALGELQNKAAVKAVAGSKGLSFPDWP